MAAAGVLAASVEATMRGLSVEVREAAIRAQASAQQAVLAESRNGIAGALLAAERELTLAIEMVRAALVLHRGVRS